MPRYDYRCPECGTVFEARHGFDAPTPACTHCGYSQPKRLITTAPRVASGIAANAGDSRGASKEQLRDKWAAETPKLREKLVSKFGEDYVSRNAPSLNTSYDD
jgi:putative FmdB family regulatory protein